MSRFSFQQTYGQLSAAIRDDAGALTIAGMFAGATYPGDWFDFSDTANMWSDTGTVVPILDTVGLGHIRGQVNASDFIQATIGSKPTWAAAGYATFDGTADFLARAASFDLYNQGAATMLAVVKANPAVSRYIFSEGNSTSTSPIYSLLESASVTATTQSGTIRNDAATILFNNLNVQTSAFDNTVRAVLCKDSGTQLTPTLDNVTGSAVNYGASRTGTVTTDKDVIGALSRATPVSFFAMDLYQLLVIGKALSAAEIAYASTFLGAKAGLTI